MFPENARMIYCIGAQKAGTTWLFHALSHSDDIHFSPNKELHYFDVISGKAQQVLDLRVSAARALAQRLIATTGPQNKVALKQLHEITSLLSIYTGERKDHRAYLSYLLEGYKGQKRVCDITPAYAILNHEVFHEMGQIGEAQFLFILRDPVARLWSQIRMAISVSGVVGAEFQHACEARARLLLQTDRIPKIERSDYERTITELDSAIPKHRIRYLFYEHLFQQDTMMSLCGFLGIRPLPILPQQRRNAGKTACLPDDLRAAFRSALDPQYRFIGKRFGKDVPAAWGRKYDAQTGATRCPE